MCGIGGVITFSKDNCKLGTAITSIIEKQSHRGPDGHGFHIDFPIAIGHSRLSIIDISTGQQPMCNETSDIWITFNGEIYNYLSIRETLASKGHIFKTHSDTEVIIHGYEEWGVKILSMLKGMFAFGIVDYKNKILFLARDIIGIKPLVYRVSNDFFAFSSEVNALTNLFNDDVSINPQSIDLFLRYGYIPCPNTIYNEVFKLPPAHYIQVSFSGDISIHQYWDFSFNHNQKLTANSHKEIIERVIDESVIAHTIADVPFGILLSGGIDSTLIASSLFKQTQLSVSAFSMNFHNEKYSEHFYAKQVSEKIGCDLESGIINDLNLDELKKMVLHFGEPFGDSSSIALWELSKLVRKKVPMVLSGDGGDEIFAGYSANYLNIMSIDPWIRLKRGIREKSIVKILSSIKHILINIKKKDIDPFQEYINNMALPNINLRKKILKPYLHEHVTVPCKSIIEQAKRCYDEPDIISKLCKFDILVYLPNDILVKVDISTMAHGLEARPPLIDKDVIDQSLQIPSYFNFNYNKGENNGKIMLKKILYDRGFSKKFLNRKKKGFTVPIKEWLEPGGNLYVLLNSIIKDHLHPVHSILNMDEVSKLLSNFHKTKKNYKILWYIIILSIWIEKNHIFDIKTIACDEK